MEANKGGWQRTHTEELIIKGWADKLSEPKNPKTTETIIKLQWLITKDEADKIWEQ